MDKLVVFTLDNQKYGIFSASIERIVRAVEITALPKFSENILGIINVHGQIVTVINLRKFLGLPPVELEISQYFIVLYARRKLITVVADEITDVMECQNKDILVSEENKNPDFIKKILKISGGFINILNPNQLLSEQDEKKLFHDFAEKMH
ncbi:MAG TPA: chemotaxis protein CheW [Gammaproteobacteria bacterium]|jgi:purine-binding chemotaxis protein CheW|nr:chemotaxis protein CheW [Gammaproteobacteria bacterium]